MLRYIGDEERKEKIGQQIQLYKSMLIQKVITDEEYETEMLMLADECDQIEKRNAELNGRKYSLDDVFDNPMSDTEELVNQAHDLFDKRVHQAIEEVENG